ncbi:hypothetical protein R1flu_011927 [Riccia fluitans]|uniref:MICOS complex subunit MIC13 n=1 Tax=Riccia fluitans TaxID=41844 RepID=A0ABD1Z961_9MARC
MASILFQERVLGFTLGTAVGFGAYVYEQKNFWRSTRELANVYSGGRLPLPPVYEPKPIFGRETKEQLIHAWNMGIDQTLGRLVGVLSQKDEAGRANSSVPSEELFEISLYLPFGMLF